VCVCVCVCAVCVHAFLATAERSPKQTIVPQKSLMVEFD